MKSLVELLLIFACVKLIVAKPEHLQQQQNQYHLDPVNEPQFEYPPKDPGKRTIGGRHYALGKHIGVHPHGFKYVLGYSPINIKYVPVIKPVTVLKPVLHQDIRQLWKPIRQYLPPPPSLRIPKPVHEIEHGWKPIEPPHSPPPVHELQEIVEQPQVLPAALPAPLPPVKPAHPHNYFFFQTPVAKPALVPQVPLFHLTRPQLNVLPLGASFPVPVLQTTGPSGPVGYPFSFPVHPQPAYPVHHPVVVHPQPAGPAIPVHHLQPVHPQPPLPPHPPQFLPSHHLQPTVPVHPPQFVPGHPHPGHHLQPVGLVHPPQFVPGNQLQPVHPHPGHHLQPLGPVHSPQFVPGHQLQPVHPHTGHHLQPVGPVHPPQFAPGHQLQPVHPQPALPHHPEQFVPGHQFEPVHPQPAPPQTHLLPSGPSIQPGSLPPISVEFHGNRHLVPFNNQFPFTSVQASVPLPKMPPPQVVVGRQPHALPLPAQDVPEIQHFQPFNPEAAIQPGQTDLQFPLHLPEHPYFRNQNHFQPMGSLEPPFPPFQNPGNNLVRPSISLEPPLTHGHS